MLASLTSKRADLQSNLEQLVGQINRTNGAIAVLDDLIREEGERLAQEAECDVAFHENVLDQMAPAVLAPRGTGDSDEPLAAALSPPLAPEMLPVRYDAELDGPEALS
jgi:hypothetical protein